MYFFGGSCRTKRDYFFQIDLDFTLISSTLENVTAFSTLPFREGNRDE